MPRTTSSLWIALPAWALVVAGCPGTVANGPETGSTSGGVAVDDTFEVPIFGDTQDSGPDSADTGADSGTDSAVDTDTDPIFTDTGLCLFGEIPDCNGTCFPAHLVGDGYCDDGVRLPADFSCAAAGFDGGDCVAGQAGCEYALLFTPIIFSQEIYWELETTGGQVITAIQPGEYAQNRVTYRRDVRLVDGTYVLDGHDTFGDGWHRATWQLVDAVTGRVVFEANPADFLTGTDFRWQFDVTCDRTTCDVDVTNLPAARPRDAGWELWSAVGTGPGRTLLAPVVARPPGTFVSPTVATERVQVFAATYELRTRDAVPTGAAADGWQGGLVSVAHPGGFVANAGGVAQGQRTGVTDVVIDCALDQAPAIPPPASPFTTGSCSGFAFRTQTRGGGEQVGWTLIRQRDFTPLVAVAPGSLLNNNAESTAPLPLEPGRYLLRLTDTAGNGWDGGTVGLRDRVGRTLFNVGLPAGANSVWTFDLDCTPDPVDTGDTEDTGPRPCLDGAEPDCRGICMPSDFLGDGQCDDGVQSSANFACAAFGFDGGDCPTDTAPVDSADSAIP